MFSEIDFIIGYVDAACWADLQRDDADETGCEAYEYRLSDMDPESQAQVARECREFIEANYDDLVSYCEQIERVDSDSPEAYAGHDFWLTRNRHGAGFWDRGMGELGDRLTESAHEFGEHWEGPWLNLDDESVRY